MNNMHLAGRGLWYSPVDPSGNPLIFNEKQWRLCCSQARTWGSTVLHPKVGASSQVWYDDDGLMMLRDIVVGDYKLSCLPYLSLDGGMALVEEVRLVARLGTLFGGICVELKEEWEVYQSPLWVARFGQQLRKSYTGPIYVTSFGFPAKHPAIPWLIMNQWMTAYLPQVFFASGKQSVEETILLVYQQWKELDQHCRETMGRPLVPIAPLIELGYTLPPGEVLTWLMKMGGYGYCGFWHAGTYLPYANTILHAPIPVRQSLPPIGKEEEPPAKEKEEEAPPSSQGEIVSLPPSSPEPSRPLLGGNTSSYPLPSRTQVYETTMIPIVKSSTPRPMGEGPETPLPLTVFGEREEKPVFVASSPLVPQSLVPYLDGRQLKLLWQSRVKDNPYNPDSPLIQRWGELVEKEANIGAPITPIKEITIDGETIAYVHCSSGKSLIFFQAIQRVLVL